jgi:hypothetical protein
MQTHDKLKRARQAEHRASKALAIERERVYKQQLRKKIQLGELFIKADLQDELIEILFAILIDAKSKLSNPQGEDYRKYLQQAGCVYPGNSS